MVQSFQMDKHGNFDEENAAGVLRYPATKPKETLDSKFSSPNMKHEDTQKRKSFDEKEEPATKIGNTTTNFNLSLPDENFDNECFIARLPPDLLSRIIELLPIKLWPNMESISRQFQAATFSAWRNLRDVDFALLDDKFFLTDDNTAEGTKKLKLCLQKLNVRSPLISSISGFNKYIHNFDEPIIISVGDFSHLRSVKFACLTFSLELFQLFFTTLKNPSLLTELHLIHIDYDVVTMSQMLHRQRQQCIANDECMTQIFRDTPLKLEVFSYEYNDGCGGEFLEFIDATNLIKVSLVGSQLDSDFVTDFVAKCSELRYLNISDLVQRDEDLELDDVCEPVLQAVASNCTKLVTLKIKYAFDIEDPECFSPLSRMENLQRLHLNVPYKDGSIVLNLVRNLQDLQNLRTLSLDAAMTVFDNELDSLCALEKLKKLVLYGGVENKTLDAWARGGLINRLKVLKLIGCNDVSDLGIEFMAKHGSENLEVLELTRSAITVDGVRNILTAFTKLRELDVRNCTGIDLRELENIENQFGMVKIEKGDDDDDDE